MKQQADRRLAHADTSLDQGGDTGVNQPQHHLSSLTNDAVVEGYDSAVGEVAAPTAALWDRIKASVAIDSGSGDVTRTVRHKERHEFPDFLWLADAAQRYPLPKLRIDFLE